MQQSGFSSYEADANRFREPGSMGHWVAVGDGCSVRWSTRCAATRLVVRGSRRRHAVDRARAG
jgi:hypothetical protein